MKIGNVGQSKGVDRSKRKKGASGAGGGAFADQLRGAGQSGDAKPAETNEVGGPQQVEGVDALLAMQEVGDSTEEQSRRQAVKYGEDLLERLNKLQDALLMGAIPKNTLMDMAHKLRQGRVKFTDPRLNDLLDEIELRVEVEIAKYTRGL